MFTTRRMLVERIKRVIGGGTSATNSRVGDVEIAHQIADAAAPLLKAQVYEGFADGESTPDGTMICTYPDLPISKREEGRCEVELPAYPMVIPGGIGVFAVYPSGKPAQAYIPVQAGMEYILQRNKLLSKIGRQTYKRSGNKIVIYDDVVGAGVTSIDMELCVTGILEADENTPLPMPPDLVEQVFIKVLQVFGIESPVERSDTKAPSPQKADVTR